MLVNDRQDGVGGQVLLVVEAERQAQHRLMQLYRSFTPWVSSIECVKQFFEKTNVKNHPRFRVVSQ